MAAVIVSVIHIFRGSWRSTRVLDGTPTPNISAFLFHAGSDDDPPQLLANKDKCFQGSIVLGMGFTFDDGNERATPLKEMHQLIAKNSRNSERIFPFIGGEEFTSSPTHEHRRYVINFGDMSEEEARRWPDLLSIIEKRVKPDRLQDNRSYYREHWWQFAEKRLGLLAAARNVKRFLIIPFVSKWHALAFIPSNCVVAAPTNVVVLDSLSAFATLQSRTHEIWAKFFGSSMKDDLRYTSSDCFQTFPFPHGWPQNSALEQAGKLYYEYRADLMVRNNEGLTATYNRFHDPDERAPDILKLRELHAEMDRAVLTAYGWTDLAERANCEFRLDYEDDDEPDADEAPRARAKKKPWRYRWPQDFHDEVLARLLDLNQQRAAEERLAGPASTTTKHPSKPAKKASKSPAKKATPSAQSSLLPDDE